MSPEEHELQQLMMLLGKDAEETLKARGQRPTRPVNIGENTVNVDVALGDLGEDPGFRSAMESFFRR